MVTNIVQKGKRFVVLGALIGVALILRMTYTGLFSVDRYVFAFDGLLAPTTQTNIKDFIEKNAAFKRSSSAVIASELKKTFPCVEMVALELVAPRVLHIDIAATKPLVTINKNQVLVESNKVLDRGFFTVHRIDHLYDVQLAHIPALGEQCTVLTQAVQKLLPSFFSQYTVMWNDEFELALRDKNMPDFSIICNADTIPDFKVLEHCQQLKNTIVQQGTAGHNVDQQWIADVRFDKQIILFSTKGGRTHG